MPDIDYILLGLREITAEWPVLAVLWHLVLAAIVAALVAGWRPERRDLGLYLLLPLVSVSALAWLHWDPFNGTVIAGLGLALLVVSMLLGRERVTVGPLWMTLPGVVLVAFGWVYPHFLDTDAWWPYIYRAPTGLIPSPTLAALAGMSMICASFDSRVWAWFLGLGGLFYGILGAVYLGIEMDWILAAGAALLILTAHLATARGRDTRKRGEPTFEAER